MRALGDYGLERQGMIDVTLTNSSGLKADRGSGSTADARDPVEGAGGYGLYLVDAYARRWGVDREGGTRVWFEL